MKRIDDILGPVVEMAPEKTRLMASEKRP